MSTFIIIYFKIIINNDCIEYYLKNIKIFLKNNIFLASFVKIPTYFIQIQNIINSVFKYNKIINLIKN